MKYLGGLSLLSVLLTACDGGGGGLDVGLEGTTPLEELDAEQAQQLCDEIQEYRAGKVPTALIAEVACVQQLGGDSGSSACAVVVAQCREEADMLTLEEEAQLALNANERSPIACFTTSDLSSCSAPVNILEGCVQSTVSARAMELNNVLSCRDSGTGAGSGSQACQILRDLCSNVSGLGGSGTPSGTRLPDGGIPPVLVDPPDSGASNPDVTCEDLSPGYDGVACSTTGCSTVIDCDCTSFSTSIGACNRVFGCLNDVDCDAVCGLSLGNALSCIDLIDCVSDTDCNGYYCVNGSCSRGDGGDPCTNSADCMSGSCIQSSTGNLACAGTQNVGDPCQSGPECITGICHQDLSGPTVVSQCSAGAIGDLCSNNDECQSQTCVADGLGTSLCADRMTGSICDSDSDCISGSCPRGGRSTGLCSEGQYDQACDGDIDCLSSNCVTAAGTFIRSCGYAPGDVCVDDAGAAGVADCEGMCRPVSTACAAGGSCTFTLCGGMACTGVTFATLNDADQQANILLTVDRLTALTTTSVDGVRATVGKSVGKWYWEVTVDSLAATSSATVGMTNATASLELVPGSSASAPGLGLQPSGLLHTHLISASTYCAFTGSSVISIALDADLDVAYFAVDGLWLGGGNPASSTGGFPVGIAGAEIFPALSISAMDQLTANFGQNPFVYEPPSGFEPGLF